MLCNSSELATKPQHVTVTDSVVVVKKELGGGEGGGLIVYRLPKYPNMSKFNVVNILHVEQLTTHKIFYTIF